jgi:hypothetical protein
VETDVWAKKYEEHSYFLERKLTYLWKGKYPCTLTKIGTFGCVAYFKDDDVSLVVDTWDIHIPDTTREILNKRTSHKCKYTKCTYGCGSPQALGKHYVKVHKEVKKSRAKEDDNPVRAR